MEQKLVKQYTLRSKDAPLADFSLYAAEDYGLNSVISSYKLKIDKIYEVNSALFPKGLQLNERQLLKWIEKRKAPRNRQFVDKLLTSIGDSDNPLKYADITHALSLNDAYWITSRPGNELWRDYNLYEHPFDEILAHIAFTGYSHKVSGVRTSPEFTSSGVQKKCWTKRADGIYLMKGDDLFRHSDGRSQCTNEYFAAQVAEVLGIEHVEYDLAEFKHKTGEREIVCLCRLFTSEDEGFADAATYLKYLHIDCEEVDIRKLSVQERISQAIGAEHYADMMLFDSLIANRDRHLGNFGVITDNNSGKVLRPAPVFDNGYSLYCTAAVNELKTGERVRAYEETLSCRNFSLDRQAYVFAEKRHMVAMRRLLEFEFRQHPKIKISSGTLSMMSDFVRRRAQKTMELYREKEKRQGQQVLY